MTDDKPTTDEKPASHVRDMEGLGGHIDEHMADDHGHGEARLGPIDWVGWGYAMLGVLAGLLVVGAFLIAITP